MVLYSNVLSSPTCGHPGTYTYMSFRCTQRSLCAVSVQNMAAVCSGAQLRGCLFYWMFISLCKTCHSGTSWSDVLKPLSLSFFPLSSSVNSEYTGSISYTRLCGHVIHPVRHCKQHLCMFINAAQPL